VEVAIQTIVFNTKNKVFVPHVDLVLFQMLQVLDVKLNKYACTIKSEIIAEDANSVQEILYQTMTIQLVLRSKVLGLTLVGGQ